VVVEHWDHEVGLFPRWHFTLAVHVPGPSQDGGQVGMVLHNLIVDCGGMG
jgi:hypothetical protein